MHLSSSHIMPSGQAFSSVQSMQPLATGSQVSIPPCGPHIVCPCSQMFSHWQCPSRHFWFSGQGISSDQSIQPFSSGPVQWISPDFCQHRLCPTWHGFSQAHSPWSQVCPMAQVCSSDQLMHPDSSGPTQCLMPPKFPQMLSPGLQETSHEISWEPMLDVQPNILHKTRKKTYGDILNFIDPKVTDFFD